MSNCSTTYCNNNCYSQGPCGGVLNYSTNTIITGNDTLITANIDNINKIRISPSSNICQNCCSRIGTFFPSSSGKASTGFYIFPNKSAKYAVYITVNIVADGTYPSGTVGTVNLINSGSNATLLNIPVPQTINVANLFSPTGATIYSNICIITNPAQDCSAPYFDFAEILNLTSPSGGTITINSVKSSWTINIIASC